MYVMETLRAKGYTPVIPPTLVKEWVLWGTGYFPFGAGDNYEIANVSEEQSGELMSDKLFLAGTAEVGIGGYHANEVLDEGQLPLKYVGFSPCFRREVGSYGRDTKGLYRIHEFFKIEQFIICKNDYAESDRLHQELMRNSEEILKALNVPYRVLQLCTGDMGAGKYKMFDLESWMPSRNSYGETHSASNLGEWQARRLNLRYKTKDGAVQYAHTLNNTAIASPRILISLMELNQKADGTIELPKVLR
jgi:seryl-tRNA synthetase